MAGNDGGLRKMTIPKGLEKILLIKCDELDRLGRDHLTDSDIMDILEECRRKNIPITRRELEDIIME